MNPNNPLDILARDLVGDGRAPNLFFVSLEGRGVITVTEDGHAAHQEWLRLTCGVGHSRRLLPQLEDRLHGTVSEVMREDGVLHAYDDYPVERTTG